MSAEKKIKKTEQEWQSELSAESYRVTRQKGTEKPFENSTMMRKSQGSTTASAVTRPYLIQTINLTLDLDGRASSNRWMLM